MARHKKNHVLYRHDFILKSDNADEQRLHDHLYKLAQEGEKSAWIIAHLIAALPSKGSRKKPRSYPGQAGGFGDWSEDLKDEDEPTYEDVE